jgi:Tfp pilus assembly protein PilZ
LVLKAEVDIDGVVREGYLTNVGSGGAFLAMDQPPKIGAELSLRTLLPWSLGELRVSGRVVWRNDPDSNDDKGTSIVGAGLAFTNLDENSRRALESYLQRFAALAAQLDETAETHDGH